VKVLGLHIATGQLRYTLLEGTKAAPTLIAKDRLLTTDPSRVAELMDWYEKQFIQLLNQHIPDRIAYRLTLAPKKSQLFTSCFPYGILYLLAHHRNIPVSPYVSANYVASRLGLLKGADIYAHCDHVLGLHPPYWDINQKHSVLAAWFELE
jgi:hypothetical protein